MQIFKDKTILITGANRGIGRSFVEALLNNGVGKIYATCRDVNKMPTFNDDRIVHLALDITDDKQVALVASAAQDTEILINNAGTVNPGNILEGGLLGMENDLQVNYFGTIKMMRAFAPILIRNKPSLMINIISIAAYSPLPSIAGYAASKAALFSATQSVRIELAKKDVSVYAVNPGAIDTDMNKGSDWKMADPDRTAIKILENVSDGTLDSIPDEMGQGMYTTWREEPAKLAKLFSDLYYSENTK
ncbi:SDR family NAD(P)-dependent oxidoreductase [Sphingobacterium sp. UDSM-2020]|uniref:SDR family NAD(P)-dependent oxidoreductase n=1 Tax=Sphingobacterium sp. UDSM-2020 TaxID=2795738 RepID=UPI001936E6D6|nr:SDR family NAD(P)-dependent oxidoreductase [Sphingobacterium sp. UDSM-2020]QQD16013.1 SDR family NAD(P)-dependent oxidoreductase [Sphingobacterium sp. UDSM-2020]